MIETDVEVISEYNGVREDNVKTNFYSNCAMIPGPAELHAEEINLLILDNCLEYRINLKH